MPDMKGKICIVTGASSGIGLATATTLIQSGASVLGVDIADAPSSLDTENFKFFQRNLIEPNAAASIVKACEDAFGTDRVDSLLNVAGILDNFTSVETMTDLEWDRVISINLTAPVKLMREVIPRMKKSGGGTIVNVSSKAGDSGAAAGLAYTTSKHGLIGATKNTAWIFKKDKIRCNAVLPGGVTTNIQNTINPETFDAQTFSILQPAQQLHDPVDYLKPEQVASLILYLASDASSGMTGSLVPIDMAWSTV